MKNRTLVSAAALFAAIILSISVLAPADVYAAKKPKKQKREPVYVVQTVPPDTVVVNQYGDVIRRIPGGAVVRTEQVATTSNGYTSQPTSTSSYNNEVKATEGGIGLSIDANRVWDSSGKPAGTSVGLGFAVGRYTAKVESNGSSSFSQDPNNPAYGWGVPTYGNNGYYGYNGVAYQVAPVHCVFRLVGNTQSVSVDLIDPTGYKMDTIRLGLQGGTFVPARVMYLPPGRYQLVREGCGPIEWVIPVQRGTLIRDIG